VSAAGVASEPELQAAKAAIAKTSISFFIFRCFVLLKIDFNLIPKIRRGNPVA
jgi:hypothetical protein